MEPTSNIIKVAIFYFLPPPIHIISSFLQSYFMACIFCRILNVLSTTILSSFDACQTSLRFKSKAGAYLLLFTCSVPADSLQFTIVPLLKLPSKRFSNNSNTPSSFSTRTRGFEIIAAPELIGLLLLLFDPPLSCFSYKVITIAWHTVLQYA